MTTIAALTGRAAVAELLRQASERLAALPFTEPATPASIDGLKRAATAVESALRALDEDPWQPSREQLEKDRPERDWPYVARCWHCSAEFGADDPDTAVAAYIAHTCTPGPPPVVPWDVLLGTRRSTARCGMRR